MAQGKASPRATPWAHRAPNNFPSPHDEGVGERVRQSRCFSASVRGEGRGEGGHLSPASEPFAQIRLIRGPCSFHLSPFTLHPSSLLALRCLLLNPSFAVCLTTYSLAFPNPSHQNHPHGVARNPATQKSPSVRGAGQNPQPFAPFAGPLYVFLDSRRSRAHALSFKRYQHQHLERSHFVRCGLLQTVAGN